MEQALTKSSTLYAFLGGNTIHGFVRTIFGFSKDKIDEVLNLNKGIDPLIFLGIYINTYRISQLREMSPETYPETFDNLSYTNAVGAINSHISLNTLVDLPHNQFERNLVTLNIQSCFSTGAYLSNRSKLDREVFTNPTQKWRGVVTDVDRGSDKFMARLYDMTKPGSDEIGSFSISSISSDDKTLIVLGAAFNLYMGTWENNLRNSKRAGVKIRFKRVPESI